MRLFKLISGKVRRGSPEGTPDGDTAAEDRARTNRAEITRLFQRELMAKKAGHRAPDRQIASGCDDQVSKKGCDETTAL